MAARAVGARKLLAAALSKRYGVPVVSYDQYLKEKDSGVEFRELTDNEIFGFNHPMERSAGCDAELDTMIDPPQPPKNDICCGRTAPRAQEEATTEDKGYI